MEFLQTVAGWAGTGQNQGSGAYNSDLSSSSQPITVFITYLHQSTNCRLKLENQNLKRKAKSLFVYMFEILHLQMQKAEQNIAQITQGAETVNITHRWSCKCSPWVQTFGGHQNAIKSHDATGEDSAHKMEGCSSTARPRKLTRLDVSPSPPFP